MGNWKLEDYGFHNIDMDIWVALLLSIKRPKEGNECHSKSMNKEGETVYIKKEKPNGRSSFSGDYELSKNVLLELVGDLS